MKLLMTILFLLPALLSYANSSFSGKYYVSDFVSECHIVKKSNGETNDIPGEEGIKLRWPGKATSNGKITSMFNVSLNQNFDFHVDEKRMQFQFSRVDEYTLENTDLTFTMSNPVLRDGKWVYKKRYTSEYDCGMYLGTCGSINTRQKVIVSHDHDDSLRVVIKNVDYGIEAIVVPYLQHKTIECVFPKVN